VDEAGIPVKPEAAGEFSGLPPFDEIIGGVSGVDEDEIGMNSETLLHTFHIAEGEHPLVPDQAAGSTRYWGIHIDGELLAVVLYRKGAEAIADLIARTRSDGLAVPAATRMIATVAPGNVRAAVADLEMWIG
jgi:hypothetical protein